MKSTSAFSLEYLSFKNPKLSYILRGSPPLLYLSFEVTKDSNHTIGKVALTNLPQCIIAAVECLGDTARDTGNGIGIAAEGDGVTDSVDQIGAFKKGNDRLGYASGTGRRPSSRSGESHKGYAKGHSRTPVLYSP